MPITNSNLYFSRGDTFVFSCLAQDYTQTVINLTGATLACSVKRTPQDTSALLTGTCTVTVAASGTFTVTFLAADTAALPAYNQVLVYDVRVTKSGLITSVQAGEIYLSAESLP